MTSLETILQPFTNTKLQVSKKASFKFNCWSYFDKRYDESKVSCFRYY